MTSTTTDLTTLLAQVLKTDCKGRIRFPARMREELLDRFERSGMSGAEFAEFYHLKYSTFASWRQKRDRARKRAMGELEGGGFVEVALPVEEIVEEDGVQVELPGGASVRIGGVADARRVAELLRALEGSGC